MTQEELWQWIEGPVLGAIYDPDRYNKMRTELSMQLCRFTATCHTPSQQRTSD